MPVTRDVIIDLYPLYRAGEASADTRGLVASFLARDPELAASLEERAPTLLTTDIPVTLTKEDEMRTLDTAKRLIRRRSWLMGFGIFFTLLPLSIRGDSEGVWFVFADAPLLVGAFLAVGTGCWLGYLATSRALGGTDL